ncbi:MAG: HNH endonuclease [Bacteroides sp.]|nr:HNH endonuclease [Bacteroides sp.]
MIAALTDIIKPSGKDKENSSKRSDSFFSQKVRNLKSHNTLEKQGYAINIKGGFEITPKGQQYLEDNIESINYLLNNEFSCQDIMNEFEDLEQHPLKHKLPFEEIISEGKLTSKVVSTRERSAKLRTVAKKYFMDNNQYYCSCCNFNFSSVYDSELDTDCIEMHHLKPIFMYEDDQLDKTIEQALANIMPVCPNCHRMIHKNHITVEKMDDFKKKIKSSTVK